MTTAERYHLDNNWRHVRAGDDGELVEEYPDISSWFDPHVDPTTSLRMATDVQSELVLHPRVPAEECYAIAYMSADPVENRISVVRGGRKQDAVYFAECTRPDFMWCGENLYVIGCGVDTIGATDTIRAFNIPYYQWDGGRGHIEPIPWPCRAGWRNTGTYREIKAVFPLHSRGILCGITDWALVTPTPHGEQDHETMYNIPYGSWQAGCEITAGVIALATMPRKEHGVPREHREPEAIICDLAMSAWYYVDAITTQWCTHVESIRTANRLGKPRKQTDAERAEWSEAMNGYKFVWTGLGAGVMGTLLLD